MLNIEIVWDAIHRVTKISRENMLSPSRRWPDVEARMLFMLFLSRRGETHEKISLFLGRKRCTITQSLHKAEDYYMMSKSFQEKYTKLKNLYEESQSVRLSQNRLP